MYKLLSIYHYRTSNDSIFTIISVKTLCHFLLLTNIGRFSDILMTNTNKALKYVDSYYLCLESSCSKCPLPYNKLADLL